MSFQKEKLDKFLSALAVVKQDYTCGFCSELCKDPVTLSTCFHLICSVHFDSLTRCPTCNVLLTGCKIYRDDRLQNGIDACQELSNIFSSLPNINVSLEPKSDSSEGMRTKHKTVSEAPPELNKENKPETSNTVSVIAKRKLNKPTKVNENLNISILPSSRSTSIEKKNSKGVTALPTACGSKGLHTKHRTVSETPPELNKENKPETSNTASVITKRKLNEPTKVNENLNISIPSSTRLNSIEKKNSKGETALHIACRLGKVDSVIELLKQGANTNTKDNAGWTPLHEVVQIGRLDLVLLLLKYNALIDVPGQSNETPLHEAIRYNHQDIAVELVKNGANIKARNCMGETPIQLASDDMKKNLKYAEENIIQSESNTVLLLSELNSDLDHMRVHCISTDRNILNKLKLLAKHHSNVYIEQKFTKKVTHLIVDTENGVCTSNFDVLQGIVNSIWILSTNWIKKSTEEKLESFQHYEVLGVGTKMYKGPRNARYNKYKQLPGIFNGCHFYLHNFNVSYEISKTMVVTKALLTKLINDAGGVVLRRVPNPESIPESERVVPYHAKEDSKLFNCSHYIIYKDMYEPMYNMSHIKALPIGWLIECIEKYELCEPW